MVTQSYILRWVSARGCFVFVTITFFLLTLSGCAKVDLVDFWDVKGHLIIEPTNTDNPLPALRYHFYNTDGKSDVITASCDGVGNYAGDLSMGIYHTIAVCPDADNTELTAMDNCETAIVRVRRITVDTRNAEILFAYPGNVYTVVQPNIVVNPNETTRHTPEPVLLTKYIQLTLALNSELPHTFTRASGVLRGVCGEIQLFSCTPKDIEPGNAPLHATRFTISPVDNWRTTIPVFGISHPNYGESYTNTLSLSLYSDTNVAEHVDVDLTDLFSDAMTGNNGILPPTVPIEIKISRSTIGIGLEGGVSPWEESGGGNGTVPFH